MTRPRKLLNFDTLVLVALALITVGFGALEIYIVSRHGRDTGHGRELFGSHSYAQLADYVLMHGPSGLEFIQRVGARLPLYPGLVLLAKAIGANSWSYVLIAIQGALGFVCGLMIYVTSRRMTSSGWIPGLVTIAYGLHASLQLEHYALRETGVYEFLVVAFFYLASRETLSRRTLALMVATCIAAYYTRPTGVLLLPALVLFLSLVPMKNRRLRLKSLGWALGAVIVAVAPWQVFQSHEQGKLTLGAANVGGLNLFKGNAFAFEDLSPYIDHDDGDKYLGQLLRPQGSSPATTSQGEDPADSHLQQLASADIRSDYLRFVRKAFLKVAIYLSPLETPLGRGDVEVDHGKLTVRDYEGNFVEAYGNWLAFAVQMSFFVVLFAVPLGFLGMLRGLLWSSRLRPIAAASLGFLLLNLAAHAAIIAETRLRLPLDPLLLLWGGIALEHLFTRSGRLPPWPVSAPVSSG